MACFEKHLGIKRINMDLLNKILFSANTNWDNNVLIIEEEQKYLFFSEKIKRDN